MSPQTEESMKLVAVALVIFALMVWFASRFDPLPAHYHPANTEGGRELLR